MLRKLCEGKPERESFVQQSPTAYLLRVWACVTQRAQRGVNTEFALEVVLIQRHYCGLGGILGRFPLIHAFFLLKLLVRGAPSCLGPWTWILEERKKNFFLKNRALNSIIYTFFPYTLIGLN